MTDAVVDQVVETGAAESAQVVEAINVNADHMIAPQKTVFRFKKDKMGNKRPNVEIANLPVPSYDGVVAILQAGGKQLELLMDVLFDTTRSVVGDWVGADEKNTAENFKPGDFTWEKIANMPKEDRRSATIPTETWEAFAKDYIEVMPGATGKSQEAVTNATIVYLKKFSIIKTDKKTLALLKTQLGIYMETSEKAEEFQDILELLLRRADTYLAADDVAALVTNL